MNDALKQLSATGFIWVRIDKRLEKILDSTVQVALAFFRQREPEKIANVLPEDCGYRPMGVEYSQSPNRPDAVESFTASVRTRNFRSALSNTVALRLHDKMLEAITTLERIAEELACEIASEISCHGTASSSILGTLHRWSCLQVNYAQPSISPAEFVNDVHEDGHLLTLVRTTVAGLEVRMSDATYLPIDTPPDQLLAMPGKTMWLLSGGKVNPLYHRVRRHPNIPERLSMLFFADIDPKDCRPWIDNDVSASEDISAHVLSNGSRFGIRGFRLE